MLNEGLDLFTLNLFTLTLCYVLVLNLSLYGNYVYTVILAAVFPTIYIYACQSAWCFNPFQWPGGFHTCGKSIKLYPVKFYGHFNLHACVSIETLSFHRCDK